MSEPNDKQKEEAREIVIQWREASEWPGLVWSAQNLSDEPRWLAAWQELESRIASALSSRDREIREVLEGLRWQYAECWCLLRPRLSNQPHEPRCLAARGLWERVQS